MNHIPDLLLDTSRTTLSTFVYRSIRLLGQFRMICNGLRRRFTDLAHNIRSGLIHLLRPIRELMCRNRQRRSGANTHADTDCFPGGESGERRRHCSCCDGLDPRLGDFPRELPCHGLLHGRTNCLADKRRRLHRNRRQNHTNHAYLLFHFSFLCLLGTTALRYI